LRDYARAAATPAEAGWRRAHVAALAALMRRAPAFTVRLIPAAPSFQYTLAEAGGAPPVVTFEGWPSPGTTRSSTDALSGFATSAPPVVAAFAEDLRRCQAATAEGLEGREATLEALDALAGS
ncbi:hypothetical protein, partial [Roseomonas sp. KE0001]|uniref:hypothetical protein n=1 Tax=Roseomonas sp. KE0001 TaxID=2479201 RepID=UPI0018DFB8A1